MQALDFTRFTTDATQNPHTCLSLPLNSPSYIRPATSYFPSGLNACIALGHALFAANLFHITHKQTKFPT
jgi:hypothetical protein